MSITEKLPDVDDLNLGSSNRKKTVIAAVVVIVLIIAGIAAWALSGNKSNGDKVRGSNFGKTFQIAYQASSASEQAFLNYLNKDIAPKYGITIDPVGIEDGNQLDAATANGQYIANIYQHKEWLKEVTSSTGLQLTALGPVFQWAYGLWSSKYSLATLPQGATIALLNDPANTAQALEVLYNLHLITFKPGVTPAQATTNDIASNPKGLKFTYVAYGSGPRVINSVDAVIDYNMSFVDAGSPISKWLIAEPPAPLDFAGQLVVGTAYVNDPQVQVLKKIFFDPAVQKYLATNTDPNLHNQLAPVSTK